MAHSNLRITLCLCLVLLIVFGAFFPSLKNGFVNWDDDNYVVSSSSISSLSASNLKSIFTSFSVGHYQPLTILSYAFDYHFFKLNPYHYHLTNLILHLLNSLLVFYLIYLLSGNIGVSFITAILFGIHPLHVESVAWVSERKDVLYSFFFLLSCITYLYYLTKGRNSKYYLLSLFLFLCSLLSKSMAVTLPLLLLLIDYYLKREPNKQLLLDKIPYLILSFVFGIIAIFGLTSLSVIRPEAHFSLFSMLAVASYGIVFYLGKFFLPINLSCLYPYYNFEYNPTYLYSIISVILLSLMVALTVKYTRKLLFGTLFFLITLLPALQFIPNSSIIVADRYTYIPSIGIFFIIATLIYWVYSKKLKVLALLLTILIIISLSCLTYNRCKVWKDGVTLWSDALENHPGSSIIYSSLGGAYSDLGEDEKAIFNFKKAFKAAIYFLEAYVSPEMPLSGKKEYGAALGELDAASNYSDAYYGIANIYKVSGNNKKVMRFCEKAIKINPNNTKAYLDLCVACGNLGDFKEAIQACSRAVELNPILAPAHYNLSVAYYFDKRYNLAMLHLQAALKLGWKTPPGFLKEIEQKLTNPKD